MSSKLQYSIMQSFQQKLEEFYTIRKIDEDKNDDFEMQQFKTDIQNFTT